MIASTNQKPDIMILQNDIVVFTAEVHSSPMYHTVTKACIGGADFLRLLRAQGIEVAEISTFAIPKLESKTCLIQIKVSFSGLFFQIHLKHYDVLAEGLNSLKKVILNQSKVLSTMRRSTIDHHYLIKLTKEECCALCDSQDCVQLPSSTHILVQASGMVYKVLYSKEEQLSYWMYCNAIQKITRPHLTISPETMYTTRIIVYRYPKVKFSPLDVKNASKCLKDLVKSTKAALDQLHALGFAHNDIRLPNICFDTEYRAVLIDLDRVTSREDPFGMFYIDDENTSCMYKRVPFMYDGRNTDYMQLGLMVAWAIDHSGESEHDRKWETMKKTIKDNQFIYYLIEEGKYKDELLDECITGNETLKTVLDKQ